MLWVGVDYGQSSYASFSPYLQSKAIKTPSL